MGHKPKLTWLSRTAPSNHAHRARDVVANRHEVRTEGGDLSTVSGLLLCTQPGYQLFGEPLIVIWMIVGKGGYEQIAMPFICNWSAD
jgi:hypothetical protein